MVLPICQRHVPRPISSYAKALPLGDIRDPTVPYKTVFVTKANETSRTFDSNNLAFTSYGTITGLSGDDVPDYMYTYLGMRSSFMFQVINVGKATRQWVRAEGLDWNIGRNIRLSR